MRKLLLTTTLIAATAVSTNAWSFGGLGILGHKSNHKGGVSAIGVHIDAENKEQPNIDIRSCDSETEELVGTECCKKTLIYTDNDTTKCCSLEGYAVQDGKCKKQCGWGWTLNEESNECECPEERRCGDVCCGEGHVCHPELNVCCHQEYEDWGEDWMDVCCPVGSVGYAGESCCEIGEVIAGEDEKHCCPAGSTHYEENLNTGEHICCSNETFFDGFCCPQGTILKDDGYCCAPDSIGYGTNPETDEGQCCEPGTKFAYDEVIGGYYCCPESSPGFGRNVAAGGKRQCCDPGTVLIIDEMKQRWCCPAGSTGYENGECIQ